MKAKAEPELKQPLKQKPRHDLKHHKTDHKPSASEQGQKVNANGASLAKQDTQDTASETGAADVNGVNVNELDFLSHSEYIYLVERCGFVLRADWTEAVVASYLSRRPFNASAVEIVPGYVELYTVAIRAFEATHHWPSAAKYLLQLKAVKQLKYKCK